MSTYIFTLKKALTVKLQSFQAGCISKYFHEWTRITSDPDILATVKGLRVDIQNIPESNQYCSNHYLSHEEKQFLSLEIKSLLKKGVITECSHEPVEYILPIFLTPKSDGSYRMILNLKKLNCEVPYPF